MDPVSPVSGVFRLPSLTAHDLLRLFLPGRKHRVGGTEGPMIPGDQETLPRVWAVALSLLCHGGARATLATVGSLGIGVRHRACVTEGLKAICQRSGASQCSG